MRKTTPPRKETTLENQERLARGWAEKYLKWNACEDSPELYAAAELVLARTKPQTMAEIGWRTSEHYLAGAVGLDGSEVVMLGLEGGHIRVCDVDDMHLDFMQVLECPSYLTPNGKRYELREVTVSSGEKVADDQEEHPKWLRDLEDYDDAPTFTIICAPGDAPGIKRTDGRWSFVGIDIHFNAIDIVEGGGAPMQVLRWGRGK